MNKLAYKSAVAEDMMVVLCRLRSLASHILSHYERSSPMISFGLRLRLKRDPNSLLHKT